MPSEYSGNMIVGLLRTVEKIVPLSKKGAGSISFTIGRMFSFRTGPEVVALRRRVLLTGRAESASTGPSTSTIGGSKETGIR